MQTRSKFIVPKFEKNEMASTEKIAIPSSDPDHVVQIPLFDYVKKLDVKVRERYLKKISTIGIDPVLIGGKHFEPDCLPPVESTHLLCYFGLDFFPELPFTFSCSTFQLTTSAALSSRLAATSRSA